MRVRCSIIQRGAELADNYPVLNKDVAEYTGLIWAALIGYAFFAETPRAMVWIGGSLVIIGCLAVARGRTLKPVCVPDAA